MFFRGILFVGLFWLSVGFAGELNGVVLPNTLSLGKDSLSLNGMALRKVHRFGIPIKVYVGGLYVPKKSQDSVAIVKDPGPKRIVMQFLRSVERDSLVSAWKKGLKENCFDGDCSVYKDQLSAFNKLMVNVRQGNQIVVTFLPDRVQVETNGPNAKSGEVVSEGFSRNLLGLFIHDKQPISKEFRGQLLGLDQK